MIIIVGASVGGVVLVAAVVGLLVWRKRRVRKEMGIERPVAIKNWDWGVVQRSEV